MAAIPYLDLSYGTNMSAKPRVRRVEYGDGYSTRAKKGLNNVPQKWQLRWDAIPEATGETLRQFFEGLGGADVIEWTPYGQATELKWTAPGDFKSKPSGYGIVDCSVTLEQEFDL